MKHKFFLVDDDAIFNTITLTVIKRLYPDSEIEVYQNSVEAIKTFTEKPYHSTIFLFDIRMPGHSGFNLLDACKELPKEHFTDCKFYLLTSSLDERDKNKGLSYDNINGYIEKPFTIDKLKNLKI